MNAPELTATNSSGRVLGLDPGRRWVGIAISDSTRSLAFPVTTIDRQGTRDDGLAEIMDLVKTETVNQLVIGLPLNAKGNEDAQATGFRQYGNWLAAALSLPLDVQDESFSNPLPDSNRLHLERRTYKTQSHHRAKKKKEHALAAVNILQLWLDKNGNPLQAVHDQPN